MAADDVFTLANRLLLGSLVVGVISTLAIVESSKIRDAQSTREVAQAGEAAAKANERAAKLEKDAAEAQVKVEEARENAARSLERATRAVESLETAKARAAEASERAANAERRATEARIQLEKLKAPRTLTREQVGLMTQKLRQFKNTRFDVTPVADREAAVFANLLVNALTASGWVFEKKASSILGSGTGIVVRINTNWPVSLQNAASALVDILRRQGIEEVRVRKNQVQGPSKPEHERIRISVLSKPVSVFQ